MWLQWPKFLRAPLMDKKSSDQMFRCAYDGWKWLNLSGQKNFECTFDGKKGPNWVFECTCDGSLACMYCMRPENVQMYIQYDGQKWLNWTFTVNVPSVAKKNICMHLRRPKIMIRSDHHIMTVLNLWMYLRWPEMFKSSVQMCLQRSTVVP